MFKLSKRQNIKSSIRLNIVILNSKYSGIFKNDTAGHFWRLHDFLAKKPELGNFQHHIFDVFICFKSIRNTIRESLIGVTCYIPFLSHRFMSGLSTFMTYTV